MVSGIPNLKELQSNGDIDGLIKIVKNDADEDVAQEVASAICEIGPPAMSLLISNLNDADKCWPLTLLTLDKIGDLAVQPLVDALGDDDRGNASLIRLCHIGAPAVNPLIKALKDYRYKRVHRIATALGWIGDKRAVTPLIDALKYEDDHMCKAAAGALGNLGDGRAVGPLIAALNNMDTCIRRAAIAHALGDLGDKKAVQPLIAILGNEDHVVRVAAAKALWKIGDEQALDSLIEASRDEKAGWVVALALGLRCGQNRPDS